MNESPDTSQVATVICSYLQSNQVDPAALPGLIRDVRAALTANSKAPEPVKAVPAVPINKSVAAGYVLCLECGARFKTLKRHLKAVHGMNEGEYRTKWALPDSYPLTAPDYSGQRSALARQMKLGHRKGGDEQS